MAGDDIVMAVSRWQLVLAWCLTAAFVASCGIVSAGEVTISAERVARVFYAGEPISLCVTADCSRQKASFEVYDYFEMHWYSGEVTIGAGQTTVVEIPRKLPFGWYGFRISVDGAMVEDAFCVIPQPLMSATTLLLHSWASAVCAPTFPGLTSSRMPVNTVSNSSGVSCNFAGSTG